MTADTFTYAGMSGGSKLVYLRGTMILNIDNAQHEIMMHFVCPSGFPSIGPKAFLSQEVDEEVVKNNPYVLKNMEILNQYMNGWKSNHPSYTLNIAYYYIYQSFLICPPVSSSMTSANNNLYSEESKVEEPSNNFEQPNPTRNNDSLDDKEFKKILVLSKIQEKLDKMSKLVKKFSVINITLSQNSDILTSSSDNICTKNAMLESWNNINTEELENFIENNEGKDISDIDEFVKPEDKVSEKMIDFIADETACEDTMDIIKSRFRKKKITMDEYLESVRNLANHQFMCMAQRRKIMSAVSALNR